MVPESGMSYWLSKRRIETRVRYERGCAACKYVSFGLLRCPACGEIYLAEWEHEWLYSRRGLRKVPVRLSRLWLQGCLQCGHIDTSNGCKKWDMDLEQVRASWWKWALPARLRRNRHKRASRQRREENARIMDKARSQPCDRCYFALFPPGWDLMSMGHGGGPTNLV